MHVEPRHTANDLERLSALQTTPRPRRRSRAVVPAAVGRSAAALAAASRALGSAQLSLAGDGQALLGADGQRGRAALGHPGV
jgi:hypothetical protein